MKLVDEEWWVGHISDSRIALDFRMGNREEAVAYIDGCDSDDFKFVVVKVTIEAEVPE